MKPESRPPFSETVSELEIITAGQQEEQAGPVEGESAKSLILCLFKWELSQLLSFCVHLCVFLYPYLIMTCSVV